MVALMTLYHSPIVRSGRLGKAVSPLDLQRMQSQPRPDSLLNLDDEQLEEEALVISTMMSQDAGEEAESDDESDDEPEPSPGKGKQTAPVCKASVNGEGPLLEADFEEVYANQWKRGGGRSKERDGRRGEGSGGWRGEESYVEGDEEGDGEGDEEGDGESDAAEEKGAKKKGAKKKKGSGWSFEAQRAAHLAELQRSHPKARCNCPLAKAKGIEGCLDDFSRASFLSFHAEFYGSELARMDAPSATGRKKQTKFDRATACYLGSNLHHEMWANKALLRKAGVGPTNGRMYRVATWELEGRAVCRKAWMAARGGTDRMHRTLCTRTLDLSWPSILCLSPSNHMCMLGRHMW
jgi:hypothetical protein